MIQSKTISEFLSNEYKDFALYTIENRAIPSVIDGFKPSQRKVIYVCNNKWKTGKEKSMKIFQLGGLVAAEAYYHHGSSSLESTIITMAQEFKNSLPLLEERTFRMSLVCIPCAEMWQRWFRSGQRTDMGL